MPQGPICNLIRFRSMSLAEFYSSRMVVGSGNPNLKFRQVAAEGGLDGAHSNCSPHIQSFALVYVRIKGRGGLAYGSSSWFVLCRRGTRRHFKVTNTQHKIQFHSGHVCLLCSNPFASSPIIMLLYIIIPVVFYTYTFEGSYIRILCNFPITAPCLLIHIPL